MQKISIDTIISFSTGGITVDILRLDRLHPVVSGNKWFKLQYYLREALAGGKDTIASFGGAYSNHIVATAFAAKEAGLKSIGFIRGEPVSNPTLADAIHYGMELRFMGREAYKDKEMLLQNEAAAGWYWIMEGGYGLKGAEGAADILRSAATDVYTDILCAAGTGTMMAGLVKAALPQQRVTGISVLKNYLQLETAVRHLLAPAEKNRSFAVFHEYHFGGYAKHPPELLAFMKTVWQQDGIPTDIVYTSKLLFAAQDLVSKGHFPAGSKLMLVHSGGLQGNRSLPPDVLPF